VKASPGTASWRKSAPSNFNSLLKRAVFLPIFICLSLLMILGVEFYDLNRSASLVIHAESVSRQIHRLKWVLLELQSSMRGFLLTRDPWFLEPFLRLKSQVDPNMAALKTLLKDEPSLHSLLESADKEIGLWVLSAEGNIQFGKDNPRGLPPTFNSYHGSMTKIRTELEMIEHKEKEKLRVVTHRFSNSQTSVFVVLISGLVFVSSLLAFLSRFHLTLLAKDFSRSQAQLQQSEETFRFLSNSIPEVVWVADPRGNITWLNQSWYDFSGLSPKDPLSSDWILFSSPGDRFRILRKWLCSVSQKVRFESRLFLKDSKGQAHLFEVEAHPILDSNKQLLFYVGTNINIQNLFEEKEEQVFQAQATKLLNSSLDYQATANAITEMSVPHLADWATFSFFGKDPKHLLKAYASKHKEPEKDLMLKELKDLQLSLGANNAELLKKNNLLILEDLTVEFMEKKIGNSEQVQLIQSLGLRSLALFPVLSGTHLQGVLLFAWVGKRDPKEPKKIQLGSKLAGLASQALRNAALLEEVREALRTRDEFISIASHELKTPLTSLSLQVQLLNRTLKRNPNQVNLPNDSTLGKGLAFCQNQINRLDNLLDQLLDVTRIQQRKLMLCFSQTDLNALGRDVCRRFQSEAEAKGISLIWNSQEPVFGQWDSNRLDQVISNLISNAIKYGNSKPVQCWCNRDPETGDAILAIEDQGPGIPSEMQDKIFERFQRASISPSIKGLGLGLYICRTIVEAHLGNISVQSNVGLGSRFVIKLLVIS